MAGKLDDFYQQVENAVAAREQRKVSYEQMYTEQHALRLAEAYLMYPWVNSEILVSSILSDNDASLPVIAEYAARKMMETGKTSADFSRENDETETIAARYVEKANELDPTNNMLLKDMRDGLRGGSLYG
jgi:hypothetical protein